MYHRIGTSPVDPWSLCVSVNHFARHVDVLRRRAQVLSLASLWETRAQPASTPTVAITFDDGYADNLSNALPILAAASVPASVFVTTDAIDSVREFWWDELEGLLLSPGLRPATLDLVIGGVRRSWDLADAGRYSPDAWEQHRIWTVGQPAPGPLQALYLDLWTLLRPCRPSERQDVLDALSVWSGRRRTMRDANRTMSTAELRRLAGAANIDIGAHTVSHPELSALDRATQAWELERSKATLEDLIGRPVVHLAYPHGVYAAETIEIVRGAGYSLACTTRANGIDESTAAFEIPRIHVHDWNGDDFESRFDRWVGMPGVDQASRVAS